MRGLLVLWENSPIDCKHVFFRIRGTFGKIWIESRWIINCLRQPKWSITFCFFKSMQVPLLHSALHVFSLSRKNWSILHNFPVISTVSHFDRMVKLCSPVEVNILFLSMNMSFAKLLIRWRCCHSIRRASSSSNPSFHWRWKLFNNEHVCLIQSTIFRYRVLDFRQISFW